jgi:hypothetical protein
MSEVKINIYVKKTTPRLNYVVNELFKGRLGLVPKLYTDLTLFENSTGAKLNYSDLEIPNIPQIIPAALLFEKRIQKQELESTKANKILYLFPIKGHSLGFDPLAAVFFHLSRYEEYLPHRTDVNGRYLDSDSILTKNGVQSFPQVEYYAQDLINWLKNYYPLLDCDLGKFKHEITVDIDQFFALKHKGLARSFLALLADLPKGKARNRLAVILGLKKDPNEVYAEIIAACLRKNIKPKFFVQVGENSRFDHNNPPHLSAVKEMVNLLALQAEVGIHPSYYSSENNDKLVQEVERLKRIVAVPITRSRQHYLRFKLPDTFLRLQELGIKEDYSMCYASQNGFRAGTCKPFKIYDLQKEEVLDVTAFPGTFMDLNTVRSSSTAEESIRGGVELLNEVRSFNGIFISIWHPEVLSGQNLPFSSMTVFNALLNHA